MPTRRCRPPPRKRVAPQAALNAAIAQRRVRAAGLHVAPSNAAALALYRRWGFRVEGTVRDYYGGGRDALRMARDLGGPLP
jgi:ribosomal protein S18 acetylase RimI-like enzyme